MKTRPDRKNQRQKKLQSKRDRTVSNGTASHSVADPRKLRVAELRAEVMALRYENECLRAQWDLLVKTVSVLSGITNDVPKNGRSSKSGAATHLSLSGIFQGNHPTTRATS